MMFCFSWSQPAQHLSLLQPRPGGEPMLDFALRLLCSLPPHRRLKTAVCSPTVGPFGLTLAGVHTTMYSWIFYKL